MPGADDAENKRLPIELVANDWLAGWRVQRMQRHNLR